MFERFSLEAREVVIRAQRIAHDLRHPQVGSEHMLLAVLSDASGVGGKVLVAAGADFAQIQAEVERLTAPAGGLLTDADAEALRSVGIDLDAVLARIEESFGPDALMRRPPGRRRSAGRGKFGLEARKSLELALRETIRLRQREITSGHLLLGLIRDNGNKATRVLTASGLRTADLRAAIETSLRGAA